MKSSPETYDFLIIGGGLFGAYAALYLQGKGYRVCLVEKERQLFRKASIVNQARLHSGYHYPRSIATARMSDDNRERFTREHRAFINFEFEKYYAIDRYGSFTDAAQFERFCRFIDIRCDRVPNHPLFNYDRLEALFATTEYTFDPILIAQYYTHQLETTDQIDILKFHRVIQAEAQSSRWEVALEDLATSNRLTIHVGGVINATYSGSNGINALFGCESIPLMHEISEIAFITSPELKGIGLTVMDGPFGSIMPYGLSGLLSVSSVAYTHHKVSYEDLPSYDCQSINQACQPDFLSDCNTCPAKPTSNYRKMLKQMGQYFSDQVSWQYFDSYFTIKSKLKASFIDDGRPTEISQLRENPAFYCIFAGKINSIYEIEKAVQ
jgi:hypothetical protein